MQKLHFCLLGIFLAIFAFSPGIHAQAWQRVYDAGGQESWAAVLPHESGGAALAGYRLTPWAGREWYFAIVDAEGELLVNATPQAAGLDFSVAALARLPNGDFALGGTAAIPGGISRMAFTRLDGAGQSQLQILHDQDSTFTRALSLDIDGNVWQAGSQWTHTQGLEDWDAYLWKHDGQGTTAWTYRSNYAGYYDEFFDIAPLPSGACVALGTRYSAATGDFDLLIMQFDANGQIEWTSQIDLGANEFGQSIVRSSTGELVVAGKTSQGSSPDALLLAKTDAQGQLLWSVSPSINAWLQAKDLSIAASGQILVVGESRLSASANPDAFLFKADELGQMLGFSTFGGFLGDNAQALLVLPDGYLLAGATRSFGDGDLDGYLVRTDAAGELFGGLVQGTVYQDINGDCQQQANEPPIEGLIVSVQGAGNFQSYGISNAQGQYTIALDTGSYFLQLTAPNAYWGSCASSWPLTLNQQGDTLSQNLGLSPIIECPQLYVEAAVPFLRRCFSNTYTIDYGNLGTTAADGLISIVLDPYFIFENSNPAPLFQSGDTLFFETGPLNPFQNGQIQLEITVDCDSSVLGQSHCLEVHISPDSLCLAPAAQWDGSNLTMTAQCLGDSVVVQMLNNGAGDMLVASNFLVIEDQIMLRGGSLQLQSGQDTTLVFYPHGNTLIVLAEQSQGNPNPQQPMIVIEGCGGFPFSTGFALQFPYPDAEPASDLDCRENVGSYDPNTKEGLPEGFGPDHAIETGSKLEYLIQFQNLGTDTAFRVAIRDTLSPWLLANTLQMGVSSHPYTWQLLNERVLKITFDPIALPDSATNEPGSVGFIRFSIDLDQASPQGSLIENRAGIYFDWNAPVITNTVKHQIGFSWLATKTEEPASQQKKAALQVFPNPMRSSAQINWPEQASSAYELRLFDTMGYCRWQRQQIKFPYTFQNPGLSSGAYVLVLLKSGQPLAGATILVR